MRNLDNIFKIIAFLLLLLFSVTSKAQVPLYQLEYAPDSNYVIGALTSGEPVWVHVDSLGLADSIYLQGDSLILLKNGSGQVYKSRIYDTSGPYADYSFVPNPQSYDIYSTGQLIYYYDGVGWNLLDRDSDPYNEGNLILLSGGSNDAKLSTSQPGSPDIVIIGDDLITVNEGGVDLDSLLIGIDTSSLLDLTTQYLNPYVIGGDTSGFYLTVAQDTVLFVATADTTAGTVDIVTGTSPIIITGDATHTPNVTIQNATTSQSGALTSTDWNTFNNKFNLPSLTSGSVLFSDGTTIAQDNANFFWDDTNNELEIKTIPIGSNGTGSLYVGSGASSGATGSSYSNFFGENSGLNASSAINCNFFGQSAGSGATNASYSNFFGVNAGSGATIANSSNYFGRNAGFNATSTGYSNFFGYRCGMSFTGNNVGANNIIIGKNISLPNGTANSMNLGGVLFGTGFQTSLSGNPKIVATSGGKIGVMTVTPVQTLDITGTTRITGSDGTSTTIMGRDGDGDVSAITASNGITLASNTLKADTSVLATQYDLTTIAPGIDSTYLKSGWGITIDSVGNTYTAKADTSKLATQYDLTQVSGGSSKAVDILGSDFTTSATSLQSTALAYTFPSTGTYEVKVYGSYTCSNTANGLSIGWIDSGGLVASYITGKHSAFTNNSSSSSTEFRKPISAIGTTLATASVNASSTPYTLISETLITVSTTGTITYGFASGSGSYSATLQAGSSLLIEKLN